jgi:serine/threonine protein kinase
MTLHQGGVKHRDIKPQNVLVTAEGLPILMDTGIIELAADDGHTMHTSVRDFVGSVRYAAPQFILAAR